MNPRDSEGNSALEALSLRHQRIGWWGLLVFLSLGALLEALHGFKVGLYLDVASEPRRLAWRLAHAHGALLSLVHVGFGLTLASRFAPRPRVAARAGALLTAATLVLPSGFFLGGAFLHGGDPGLGVLLVPLGALLLFGAVFEIARGLGASVHSAAARPAAEAALLELREVAFGSPEYEAGVALRTHVLREPLGLKPSPEERDEEARLVHLGAFEGAALVACLMLHDVGDRRVRMRQVAVDFAKQRIGVGTRLVAYSETFARRAGFREMLLHAREPAVPFYERLGYESYGEPFIEVTIPHRRMRKAL